MDPTFQTTSFIPKRPLNENKAVAPRSASSGIFLLIGIIVFVLSLLASAGVFFYKKSIENKIITNKETLTKAKDAFEPDTIALYKRFDKRLISAEEILKNHITVSPILRELNALTLKKVQFTKFKNKVAAVGKSTSIEVEMQGKGDSFSMLAIQSDKLTESRYILNPVFSNLSVDLKGSVLFDLKFGVDPNLILFTQLVDRGIIGGAQSIPTIPSDLSVQPTTNNEILLTQ